MATSRGVVVRIASVLLLPAIIASCSDSDGDDARAVNSWDATVDATGRSLLDEGRRIFRHDTFGDEAFWGDTLRLHEALATLPPRGALENGLKVDSLALPSNLVAEIGRGEFDLDDPANTLELLRHDSVLGVKGLFDSTGATLTSVGISCALCHSTVDDSVTAGIGERLDGWPNRDLNVGNIVSLAPDLGFYANLLRLPVDSVRTVLQSWGPGKFDAQLLLDGKAFRPDGKPAATLIPPAYGLAGVNLATSTGAWGGITYWNAFVANLEMQGKGSFFDPRLDDPLQYPVAARSGMGHKVDEVDLITPKLPALHYYQLSIPSPVPPTGSFDAAAAARGQALFAAKADCARCHVPPTYSEPGTNLHRPEEIGIDSFQSDRSPNRRYRTAPLRGLWAHAKGGFYHDGRFETLNAVVDHYDAFFVLELTPEEKADLVQFLISI